ncbi:MAG: hypothetical protein RL768_2768 [Nitrospirota bacterium]|jgi:hypothetical protein
MWSQGKNSDDVSLEAVASNEVSAIFGESSRLKGPSPITALCVFDGPWMGKCELREIWTSAKKPS